MKKILNFSIFSMLLALSLTAGNTTVSAKCANEEVGYTCNQEWHVEGIDEENASEDMEVSKEDESEEVEVVATEVLEEVVVVEDQAVLVKAAEVVIVPATEAPATEDSQNDNGVVQEDLVEANATALEATVEEVQEEVAETPSEEITAEDDVIVGVPPVIAEEPAEEEEEVVEEKDEEVVTVEEDEIANSGVKKETVQKNAKKSQDVQATVKTVTNNKSTTAILPQTGVLSDNMFYVLGSMICALGAISLAVAKRRAIK